MKRYNYRFNSKEKLIALIRNEANTSRELFIQTKNPVYNVYATYCETVINKYSDYNKQQIQQIKFNNLREFILNEWISYETVLYIGTKEFKYLNSDSVIKIDSLYEKIRNIALDRLNGIEFFNSLQLQ